MQEAIEKAHALIEAHAYIRQFAGRRVVVKVGGSIMDDPKILSSLVMDICFMAALGIKPILVHGGGKGITSAMKKAGIEAHFVQGRRYTDERTLAIAEHVLVNEINTPIVEQIKTRGHQAVGLHSLASCVVFGKRLFLNMPDETDTSKIRRIDIGYVGEVDWVNSDLLKAVTDAGQIPVVSPIVRDASGAKLNVNADSVAGHIAASLQAEKLVLVSDTHGIRTSEDQASLASHLTATEIGELIENNIINAGMLPKVQASLTALQGGVAKAHIIDGRIQHSLMLEIYTNKGIGTEIIL